MEYIEIKISSCSKCPLLIKVIDSINNDKPLKFKCWLERNSKEDKVSKNRYWEGKFLQVDNKNNPLKCEMCPLFKTDKENKNNYIKIINE